MTSVNVKTLLFISSADKVYSHSFLYHCAKYWAQEGMKVLFITHEPFQSLPYSIGIDKTVENIESFCMIQFMYLPKWQDLLKHCYSIHLQQNPASVIIVHELENYCVCDRDDGYDHVSLVCASLLQAASVSASKNSGPSYLICGFNSENCTIPGTLCKSFFHNIWEITTEDEEIEPGQRKLLKLSKLSHTLKSKHIKLFVFSENDDQRLLDYESAFEEVIRLCE